MEGTETAESSVPEGYVRVEQASDDEIASAFESLTAEQPSPEPESDSSENIAEVGQPSQVETPQPQEEEGNDEVISKEKYEQLLQQLNQKEQFIQRRNQELGEARKLLRQQNEALKAGLEEKFHVSPLEALQDRDRIVQNEQKLQQIDNVERQSVEEARAARMIAQNVQPGEVDMNDIIHVLRTDGVPENYIQAFQANMYQSAPPEALLQLVKRGAERRQMRNLVGFAKEKLQEVETLKKQLEEARGRPNRQLQNISQAMRQNVPNSMPTGNAPQKLRTANDVTRLSDSELEELLSGR